MKNINLKLDNANFLYKSKEIYKMNTIWSNDNKFLSIIKLIPFIWDGKTVHGYLRQIKNF